MAEPNQTTTWRKAEGLQEAIHKINAYHNNHSSHLHPSMCLTIPQLLPISQATREPNNPVHPMHNQSLPSLIHSHHNRPSPRNNHLFSHNRQLNK